MSKFVIREVDTGVKFDLKAPNGQVILTSEVYRSRAACLRGIASIRASALKAKIADLTEEACAALTNPKFELYRDKAGQYRFRLRSRNGQIIGVSDGYAAKTGCAGGIESVIRNAALAEIEE